jgi:hypothetical protein
MRIVISLLAILVLTMGGVMFKQYLDKPYNPTQHKSEIFLEHQLRSERMRRYAEEKNPIWERKILQVEDERKVVELELELNRIPFEEDAMRRASK